MRTEEVDRVKQQERSDETDSGHKFLFDIHFTRSALCTHADRRDPKTHC